MSSKRIAKDFANCSANAPTGMVVTLPVEGNMSVWHVQLEGPADTVYEGGKFGLVVALPEGFPFKPPTINFATRIYHPNVTNDDFGNICLSMLKTDNWKPMFSLRTVLEAVRNLLVEPQPDDPLEARIADQYRTERAEFDQLARAAVAKYASGEPTYPPVPAAS
ncbi:ubiquitin-conjugating enzyme [Ophiostoma piceae UAMH 11346]|uniref:E2 ubiquitin-conjugating enzyme n=1 Tax=Ophiostoma piceae (strain UAMH 11346) TaxID=1262450 RepID=S3CC98_OPHP1|nr:ubiquitin-conjugating enzyme [Ophiostoma piceae UAMH 11346]